LPSSGARRRWGCLYLVFEDDQRFRRPPQSSRAERRGAGVHHPKTTAEALALINDGILLRATVITSGPGRRGL
jgi:hypothetical protein